MSNDNDDDSVYMVPNDSPIDVDLIKEHDKMIERGECPNGCGETLEENNSGKICSDCGFMHISVTFHNNNPTLH